MGLHIPASASPWPWKGCNFEQGSSLWPEKFPVRETALRPHQLITPTTGMCAEGVWAMYYSIHYRDLAGLKLRWGKWGTEGPNLRSYSLARSYKCRFGTSSPLSNILEHLISVRGEGFRLIRINFPGTIKSASFWKRWNLGQHNSRIFPFYFSTQDRKGEHKEKMLLVIIAKKFQSTFSMCQLFYDFV